MPAVADQKHPSFGPLSPEEFARLVASPAGVAEEVIREKYDPWFGLKGQKVKVEATFRREVEQYGTAEVEAASPEEARKLVDNLPDSEVYWDDDGEPDDATITVESIAPIHRKRYRSPEDMWPTKGKK